MGPVTYRAGCTSQDSLVLCLRTVQTQSVAVYLLDTHSVILHDYIHTALYGNMPSALLYPGQRRKVLIVGIEKLMKKVLSKVLFLSLSRSKEWNITQLLKEMKSF